MTNYLFIETRDPFESRDTQFVEETAIALQKRGHSVTVFLMQNGVLASRRHALCPALSRMVQSGVSLLADDFSLCERGLDVAELQPGVEPASIEKLVDLLVQENSKAVWH